MRRWCLLPFACGLVACGLLACGDDHASPTAGGGPSPTTTATGDPCAPPSPGCPCTEPGSKSECKVYRKVGSYISCSSGEMTCGDAGAWSACEGAATIWDGG